MKSILISFFGTSNIGDLLISSSLKEKVEKFATVVPVDYLGHKVIEEMNIEKNTTTSTSTNKTKKKLKALIKRLPLNSLMLRLKKRRNAFYYPDFEARLTDANALIIGGGNMIFDLEPDTLSAKRFGYYVENAKKRGVPVYAISLGIGPFQNKYQLKSAVEALAMCDYITFRDNRSYELFREFNDTHKHVAVVPDPVFFMATDNLTNNRSKIGINIINPVLFGADLNSEKIQENYVALLNQLLTDFTEEIVIYNTEEKDFDYCKAVYQNFVDNQRVTLAKVNSLSDLYNVYDSTKIIIGTRMHSMITAFSQGIPIIGISWQQKVDAMFELLGDSRSVFKISELGNNIIDISKLLEEKLNAHTDYQKNYHPRTMEKLKELEKVNLEYLEKTFTQKNEG